MKATFLPAGLAALLAVAGCAKQSADIAAAYVSPLQYQQYSCSQIAAEAQSVSSRASALMGVQDKKAQSDQVAMGVGLVLFWPALFFLHPNAESAGEVARLKGEMEALEQASIQKRCKITFQHAAPAPGQQAPAAAAPQP